MAMDESTEGKTILETVSNRALIRTIRQNEDMLYKRCKLLVNCTPLCLERGSVTRWRYQVVNTRPFAGLSKL